MQAKALGPCRPRILMRLTLTQSWQVCAEPPQETRYASSSIHQTLCITTTTTSYSHLEAPHPPSRCTRNRSPLINKEEHEEMKYWIASGEGERLEKALREEADSPILADELWDPETPASNTFATIKGKGRETLTSALNNLSVSSSSQQQTAGHHTIRAGPSVAHNNEPISSLHDWSTSAQNVGSNPLHKPVAPAYNNGIWSPGKFVNGQWIPDETVPNYYDGPPNCYNIPPHFYNHVSQYYNAANYYNTASNYYNAAPSSHNVASNYHNAAPNYYNAAPDYHSAAPSNYNAASNNHNAAPNYHNATPNSLNAAPNNHNNPTPTHNDLDLQKAKITEKSDLRILHNSHHHPNLVISALEKEIKDKSTNSAQTDNKNKETFRPFDRSSKPYFKPAGFSGSSLSTFELMVNGLKTLATYKGTLPSIERAESAKWNYKGTVLEEYIGTDDSFFDHALSGSAVAPARSRANVAAVDPRRGFGHDARGISLCPGSEIQSPRPAPYGTRNVAHDRHHFLNHEIPDSVCGSTSKLQYMSMGSGQHSEDTNPNATIRAKNHGQASNVWRAADNYALRNHYGVNPGNGNGSYGKTVGAASDSGSATGSGMKGKNQR
ncbi:hypothetical protein RUND412_001744 [Rhizina undulata]